MMGWHWGDTGWGGWLVMAVVMVAFWALVTLAVVAIFRGAGTSRGTTGHSTPESPLDILAERFARGEIDAQEYNARRQVLRDERSGATHRIGR